MIKKLLSKIRKKKEKDTLCSASGVCPSLLVCLLSLTLDEQEHGMEIKNLLVKLNSLSCHL